MKNLIKLSLVALLLVTGFSCSSDDDGTPQPQPLNIVETAQATANLSILVDAAIQAGLVDALSADGPLTVLAPTNLAFTNFLADKGFASLTDVPNDVLTQILLNHVISGEVPSSALVGNTGYASTLATGPGNTNLSLFYNGTTGVVFNGGATVMTADVSASNGIVHIIDEVIDLPTIATFATTNPALTNLVAALGSADSQNPSPGYIPLLADPASGPFTVFAPTDTAFADLLMELDPTGMTGLGDVAPATVEAIITYHVVGSGNVTSSQLMSGPLTTLGGDVDLDAANLTITDANMRVSNIIPTLVDIQAINGVVHAIDKVIRP